MKSVPRIVSDVKRTKEFLGVKYVFIKKGSVPRFMVRMLSLTSWRMIFWFFCCVVGWNVSSCITTF